MIEKVFVRGVFALHLTVAVMFVVFAGLAGFDHATTIQFMSSSVTWAGCIGLLASATCYLATLWSRNEDELTALSRTIAAGSVLGLAFSRIVLPMEITLDAFFALCAIGIGGAFMAMIAVAKSYLHDRHAPGFFYRLSILMVGLVVSWRMFNLPNGTDPMTEFLANVAGLGIGAIAFILVEGLANLPRRIDITA